MFVLNWIWTITIDMLVWVWKIVSVSMSCRWTDPASDTAFDLTNIVTPDNVEYTDSSGRMYVAVCFALVDLFLMSIKLSINGFKILYYIDTLREYVQLLLQQIQTVARQ